VYSVVSILLRALRVLRGQICLVYFCANKEIEYL
jgi:hypothetical protein